MEVTNPLTFLAQVFNPGQMAIFVELLQVQEYPLFAHLGAGHFFEKGSVKVVSFN